MQEKFWHCLDESSQVQIQFGPVQKNPHPSQRKGSPVVVVVAMKPLLWMDYGNWKGLVKLLIQCYLVSSTFIYMACNLIPSDRMQRVRV